MIEVHLQMADGTRHPVRFPPRKRRRRRRPVDFTFPPSDDNPRPSFNVPANKQETDMATQTTDITHRLAARRALDELQPHADDHPGIADVVEQLQDIAGGESEGSAGEIEKAMQDMVSLEKSDRIGADAKERARAARGELGVAYLAKCNSAYGETSARQQIERARMVEQGGLGDFAA